nr:hypothetical protein [Microbacterium lacticum]
MRRVRLERGAAEQAGGLLERGEQRRLDAGAAGFGSDAELELQLGRGGRLRSLIDEGPDHDLVAPRDEAAVQRVGLILPAGERLGGVPSQVVAADVERDAAVEHLRARDEVTGVGAVDRARHGDRGEGERADHSRTFFQAPL